jgi:Ner family transcriptional regulator
MATPSDWHKEDIKAAVRQSGATLRSLSEAAGYHHSVANQTLCRPWPAIEAVIARHLGVHPMTIWPSRYDMHGNPKTGILTAHRKAIRIRRAAATENAASR